MDRAGRGIGSQRMLSQSARIGAPVIGFVLGLVVTYGLADAGPSPVPTRILRDAMASQIPIGSRMRFAPIGDTKFAERPASFRDEFDERFASLEERFTGAKPPAETVETPAEVQAMAYRVGLATMRQLLQSSARAYRRLSA
jgi:hypothetical protein